MNTPLFSIGGFYSFYWYGMILTGILKSYNEERNEIKLRLLVFNENLEMSVDEFSDSEPELLHH